MSKERLMLNRECYSLEGAKRYAGILKIAAPHTKVHIRRGRYVSAVCNEQNEIWYLKQFVTAINEMVVSRLSGEKMHIAKNSLVIDGVIHELKKDPGTFGNCEICSVKSVCRTGFGGCLSSILFERRDYHFEIKEGGANDN